MLPLRTAINSSYIIYIIQIKLLFRICRLISKVPAKQKPLTSSPKNGPETIVLYRGFSRFCTKRYWTNYEKYIILIQMDPRAPDRHRRRIQLKNVTSSLKTYLSEFVQILYVHLLKILLFSYILCRIYKCFRTFKSHGYDLLTHITSKVLFKYIFVEITPLLCMYTAPEGTIKLALASTGSYYC